MTDPHALGRFGWQRREDGLGLPGGGLENVGDLWDLYTTYPYMPRLRDRSVLEDAVREVLNSFIWEIEGFALATGRSDGTGGFTGLAIPHRDTFGVITDAVILVRPDVALAQIPGPNTNATGGEPGAGTGSPGTGETSEQLGRAGSKPAPDSSGPGGPRSKTRYFAVTHIDPGKYGRDLTRLQQDILSRLADPDAGEVTITVEIEATRPGGFTPDKIRVITENARVLKF